MEQLFFGETKRWPLVQKSSLYNETNRVGVHQEVEYFLKYSD